MRPTGILLRRDVVARGYEERLLSRAVRRGDLHRVRQGAYTHGARWADASRRERHALASEAVLLQYGGGIALSHDSAVVRLGGPDHGLELDAVHVTHFDGGGRRAAGIVHHEGRCGLLDVTRRGGDWVTSPSRTVLDVARSRGVETGVVVADDFIRRAMTSTAELEQLADAMKAWPGALSLRIVTGLATGRSESVGESLAWLMFRRLWLPMPIQQYEVRDHRGHLLGRTDWAWPDAGLLCEFDGVEKYVRHLRPGETTADAVIREKRREDRLREVTGWRFLRLGWSDLFKPEQTGARVRRALERRSSVA